MQLCYTTSDFHYLFLTFLYHTVQQFVDDSPLLWLISAGWNALLVVLWSGFVDQIVGWTACASILETVTLCQLSASVILIGGAVALQRQPHQTATIWSALEVCTDAVKLGQLCRADLTARCQWSCPRWMLLGQWRGQSSTPSHRILSHRQHIDCTCHVDCRQ